MVHFFLQDQFALAVNMCEIFGVLHKVKIFILCLSFFSDNGTVCTSTYPIFGQVGHGPLFFTRSVCSSSKD